MSTLFCPPYEIIEEMVPGHLYKGISPDSGELVAIRTVQVGSGSTTDTGLLIRLQTWVDTMRTLHHPHIARLIDVKHGETGVFIISEWCEGHSLRTLLQAQQEVAHPLVVYYMQQVASGLDFLHSRGFYHRDFTLQRVLIDPGGTAKLIDVGLLGVIPDIERQGGLEGVERGYLSPEELLGQGPSPDADLFRFSVACFELLAGTIPFFGNTPAELRESILSRSRTLPDAQRRSLPRHLVKFFENALSIDVRDRPETASQLIKPIAQLGSHHSGLGVIGADFYRRRKRSFMPARLPRSLAVIGLGALLGVAIVSTHLAQLIGVRNVGVEDVQTRSASRQEDAEPFGGIKNVQPDESKKITAQLLSLAQRRTGGEKEVLPVLREMIAIPPSTPITATEQQLLRSLLEHDNPALRYFVVRVIERRNIEVLSEPLVSRLYDGDAAVRAATVRALQAMAVPVPVRTLSLRAAAESAPSVHAKLLELAEGLAAESKIGNERGR